MKSNRFIVGGHTRLLQDKAIQKQIARIRVDVAAKYAEELSRAGFFRRFVVQHRIKREIREEIDKVAPSGALYFTSEICAGHHRHGRRHIR